MIRGTGKLREGISSRDSGAKDWKGTCTGCITHVYTLIDS